MALGLTSKGNKKIKPKQQQRSEIIGPIKSLNSVASMTPLIWVKGREKKQ